jgi:hypothetical protein
MGGPESMTREEVVRKVLRNAAAAREADVARAGRAW